jgi:hypothetical protein
MIRCAFLTALVCSLFSMRLLPTRQAAASTIGSRAELTTALFDGGTPEDFESFEVADASANILFVNTLNATTVALQQGPELVVNGVTFIAETAPLQWNGHNWYGLQTRTFLAESFLNENALTVDFTEFVQGFGVDLLAFQGFPRVATVEVFAADDSTILATTSGIALTGPAPVFIGYVHLTGIGKVRLSQSGFSYSPVIDNLVFGVLVPEPSGEFLLAIILTAWTRQATNKRCQES